MFGEASEEEDIAVLGIMEPRPRVWEMGLCVGIGEMLDSW